MSRVSRVRTEEPSRLYGHYDGIALAGICQIAAMHCPYTRLAIISSDLQKKFTCLPCSIIIGTLTKPLTKLKFTISAPCSGYDLKFT